MLPKNKIILSLYLLPVENGVSFFHRVFFAPNPHNLPFRQIVTHIFIHSYFSYFRLFSELSTLSTILYTFLRSTQCGFPVYNFVYITISPESPILPCFPPFFNILVDDNISQNGFLHIIHIVHSPFSSTVLFSRNVFSAKHPLFSVFVLPLRFCFFLRHFSLLYQSACFCAIFHLLFFHLRLENPACKIRENQRR